MGEPVAQRGLGERAGLLAHGGEVQRAAGRLDLKRRRLLGHGACSSRARGEQRVVAGAACDDELEGPAEPQADGTVRGKMERR